MMNTTKLTDAMKRVIAARTTIVLDEPFFGSLSHNLDTIEVIADPSVRTLQTNGKWVKFNPDFVNSRDAWTNVVDLCHEVLHCADGHVFPWRTGWMKDKKRANVAGDYVVNAQLMDIFKRLPTGYLYDAKYTSMSIEQVYKALSEQDGEDEGNDEGEDGNEGDKDGDGDGEPNGPGGFECAPEGEASTLEAEWQVATLQAANAAKMAGKLPGCMEDLIKSIKETRVDWRSAAMKWAQQVCKTDYSWSRRNKRYADIYLPSQFNIEMGEMGIFIDVSGSCLHALPSFGHAANAIVDQLKPERVHVLYVDTQVSGVDTFERGETITFNVRGGGGTNFAPAFDWITEHGIDPACVIYLTDLEASFDFPAPDYPVLWASTEKTVAPFGETLFIGDDL